MDGAGHRAGEVVGVFVLVDVVEEEAGLRGDHGELGVENVRGWRGGGGRGKCWRGRALAIVVSLVRPKMSRGGPHAATGERGPPLFSDVPMIRIRIVLRHALGARAFPTMADFA